MSSIRRRIRRNRQRFPRPERRKEPIERLERFASCRRLALIENTANGPALYAAIRKKAKFRLQLVTPRRDSKAGRLNDHLPKIRNKRIYLPESEVWREAFIDEVMAFPSEFDDQVDAMTQYLDFLDGNPIIPPPSTRATGVVVFAQPLSGIRRF